MVYQTVIKKKRFEEEGNIAIPQKNRPFKLKERMVIPKVPAAPQPKAPLGPRDHQSEEREVKNADGYPLDTYIDMFPKMDAKTGYVKSDTDESGLDQAYANSSSLYLDKDGTLYVAGTKGNFWDPEWVENYMTMGVPLVAQALGIPLGYSIEDNARYTELDNFMKSHPGMVKNFVGHSKGSAVIHRWMQNHPEFTGQSRLYATPYEDILGKDAIKTGLNDFKEKHNNSILNAMIDEGEKYLD